MTGNRTSTLHGLHQKYGPTLLIGPNEITVNDISNVKDLYGQQTEFIKAPVYEFMTQKPHGIFALRDRVAHGQRRKLLSHAFSQSNIRECEPLIQNHVDKLLLAVEKSAGKPIDMLRWFRLTAFDVVGESTTPALLTLTLDDRTLTRTQVNSFWVRRSEVSILERRHSFWMMLNCSSNSRTCIGTTPGLPRHFIISHCRR